MELKCKNSSCNECVVIYLGEKGVLHKKIGFLFRKKIENIQIQNGPLAAILNFASQKFSAAC